MYVQSLMVTKDQCGSEPACDSQYRQHQSRPWQLSSQ